MHDSTPDANERASFDQRGVPAATDLLLPVRGISETIGNSGKHRDVPRNSRPTSTFITERRTGEITSREGHIPASEASRRISAHDEATATPEPRLIKVSLGKGIRRVEAATPISAPTRARVDRIDEIWPREVTTMP